MKKEIWKWLIEPNETAVSIPVGAEILTIQEQHGEPRLWALVDPDAEKEERSFKVYGTGQLIKEKPGKYISTFQMHKGRLVFHVFELIDDHPPVHCDYDWSVL